PLPAPSPVAAGVRCRRCRTWWGEVRGGLQFLTPAATGEGAGKGGNGPRGAQISPPVGRWRSETERPRQRGRPDLAQLFDVGDQLAAGELRLQLAAAHLADVAGRHAEVLGRLQHRLD